MFIPRNSVFSVVLTLVALAAGKEVGAQIHPTDMRSGSMREFATTPVTIFTVPSDSYFVLTDLVWSALAGPGVQQGASCNLYGDGVERWRIRGNFVYDGATSFQSVPFQTHFATGLAFDPGEVVTFESTAHVSGSYSLVWSGYVVPATAAAIDLDSPSRWERTLGQNEPNPFGSSTLIRYVLVSPGAAEIGIFDPQGRRVRTLVEGEHDAGEHSVIWDGRNDAGASVATGVYYYEIQSR